MGSVPAELSLDIRPSPSPFVPKSITDFLCEVSTLPPVPDKLSSLNDFLARLEDEFTKIHAFKRELPLSMLLLNDAITALKAESEKCRAHHKSVKPVLEEFIPLKKELDHSEEEEEEEEEEDHHDEEDNESCRDKKSWMSSVQLWNTPSVNLNPYDHKHHHHHHKFETKKNEEQGQSVAEDLFQSCRNRSGGRAFMPFSTAYTSVTPVTLAAAAKEEKEDSAINRLSLLTPAPGVKSLREGSGSSGSRTSSNRAVSSSPSAVQPSLRAGPLHPQQQQTARKQRRCWSPELHRRFVNALQKLGGSQVATPKQIRELMQVDGLTNDEVKSHLQKYRLHTLRVPSGSGNQNVVVLGGLWMSQGGQQDQYNDSSKGSSSGSGSPQSHLHLATGGASPTQEDSMEDDEDAKSESYSWRSHTLKPGKINV